MIAAAAHAIDARMKLTILALVALAAGCGGASSGRPAATPSSAAAPPSNIAATPSNTATTPANPSTTTATPRPEDPCAASAIDFDAAAAQCVTHGPETPAPSPAVLRLSMADVRAASGAPAELTIEMRNVGSAPLTLVLTPGCGFVVDVFDQAGHLANQEGDEPPMGGLCADGPSIGIRLPPNGVLTKHIHWTVRKKRFVCAGEECREEAGSPIPPGTYRVKVDTPFRDPVHGERSAVRPRLVSATLTVTPAAAAAATPAP